MNKKIEFTVMFLILATGNIFILGCKQIVPANEMPYSSVQLPQTIEQSPVVEITRAEQVMKAIAEAYSRQIEKVEYRNDDWAVLLRDTWFYYAGGKLLPEGQLENAANFSSQPFYNYQRELPIWREPSPEEAERYSNMARNRGSNPLRRSTYFFDALWRAGSRSESYDRVKSILFFGNSITVHYMILENLSLVEETILAAAKTNSQVQTWINNISTLEGWSWRDIADTQSRSFHAYGIAVDILPRSLGGRQTYWLWASNSRADWWNISYNERFHPPAEVIQAFETYGFIWGGKWLYFDTMHFEYRPEILVLSGMPPETRR
ncbi:MAG: M15 family metallopeptidase [Treponema sp.]|jgi:hypothetical protein|nr:M15 family metallopeptidase [Treponema sp.]